MKEAELIAFWREVVDGYEQSGLTVRAWCHQHQKSTASFYRWRRYFADENLPSSSGFVRVPVSSSVSDESSFPVTLPNGLVVHVAAGFSEGSLRRLLSVLQQA